MASDEEVQANDLAFYARDAGVSMEEAEQHAQRRRQAQPAMDEAAEHPGFAGARVVRDRGLEVEIRFEGRAPAAVREKTPGNGAVRLVENVGWSLAQRMNQMGRVMADLEKAGFRSAASYVDRGTGKIVVDVTRPKRGRGGRVERPDLPPTARASSVSVAFSDREGGLDHGYGGDRIRADGSNARCTTGFVVTNGYGTTGVLTAGHCADNRYMDPVDGSSDFDTPYVGRHQGYWGDFQWHTTTYHYDYDDFYYDNWTRRDLAYIGGTVAENDYLCRFGVATANQQCDWVYKVGVVHINDGITYQNLVAFDRRLAATGDSGGPIFYWKTAWGIHHGWRPIDGVDRDLYSQARYVWNALGVAIKTS